MLKLNLRIFLLHQAIILVQLHVHVIHLLFKQFQFIVLLFNLLLKALDLHQCTFIHVFEIFKFLLQVMISLLLFLRLGRLLLIHGLIILLQCLPESLLCLIKLCDLFLTLPNLVIFFLQLHLKHVELISKLNFGLRYKI